eukprot:9499096-Pyramimonas_sp.AAC.1
MDTPSKRALSDPRRHSDPVRTYTTAVYDTQPWVYYAACRYYFVFICVYNSSPPICPCFAYNLYEGTTVLPKACTQHSSAVTIPRNWLSAPWPHFHRRPTSHLDPTPMPHEYSPRACGSAFQMEGGARWTIPTPLLLSCGRVPRPQRTPTETSASTSCSTTSAMCPSQILRWLWSTTTTGAVCVCVCHGLPRTTGPTMLFLDGICPSNARSVSP